MGGIEGPGGRDFKKNEYQFNPRAPLPLAALENLIIHRAKSPACHINEIPYFLTDPTTGDCYEF
ncbi:hypothetical protein TREPR_3086 [Treponema primitia ZAS-2]|uniref:Uncharacterized protein n=1 Tax=Treponema primitia (strain ATCC BAA-887 / DSM 12427 / ZAS-2) TaxID=545694 RepID=F5YMM2_TREPZ|nr:hypothetical protein TREPR_3086 [Treponema primitia ZAS-2]